MPQRTNYFQHLVFRLQSALHDRDCTIEESALVMNHVSKNREEIDILVTFRKGGQEYKTGFSCREHSRPAGPSWIRDLAKQREHCRLDKMIAVHSKGFSGPAVITATTESIMTLVARDVESTDWLHAIDLPDEVMTTTVSSNIWFEFELVGESKLTAEPRDLIIAGSELPLVEFHKLCREQVHQWCQNQIICSGTTPTLPTAFQRVRHVRFSGSLPQDSVLRLRDESQIKLAGVSGQGAVKQELRFMLIKKRAQIRQTSFVDAEHQFFGQKVNAVVAMNNGDKRLHLEPAAGSGIVFNDFQYASSASPKAPLFNLDISWHTPIPQHATTMIPPLRRRVAAGGMTS